mgnify:CR=1 FL=1
MPTTDAVPDLAAATKSLQAANNIINQRGATVPINDQEKTLIIGAAAAAGVLLLALSKQQIPTIPPTCPPGTHLSGGVCVPDTPAAHVPTVDDADVNRDGIVNQQDFDLIAAHFLARRGDPNYDARYDLDRDGAITILDLTAAANFMGRRSSWVPTVSSAVEQLIATRGSRLMPHEIAVPPPMSSWAWGQHATESTKSKQPSSGSVAAWLVVMPDASQLGGVGAVRFNVRRIALWNFEAGVWRKLYDGLPQWRVSINPDTTSGMVDIAPTIEADGSHSFAIPAGKSLHMAQGPWPRIASGGGIVAAVEARLLGSAAAVSTAKVGVDAGADYRGPTGDFSQGFSTPGYYESGFGRFLRLTGEWRAAYMLSSYLTDEQVRQNPPVLQ